MEVNSESRTDNYILMIKTETVTLSMSVAYNNIIIIPIPRKADSF